MSSKINLTLYSIKKIIGWISLALTGPCWFPGFAIV